MHSNNRATVYDELVRRLIPLSFGLLAGLLAIGVGVIVLQGKGQALPAHPAAHTLPASKGSNAHSAFPVRVHARHGHRHRRNRGVGLRGSASTNQGNRSSNRRAFAGAKSANPGGNHSQPARAGHRPGSRSQHTTGDTPGTSSHPATTGHTLQHRSRHTSPGHTRRNHPKRGHTSHGPGHHSSKVHHPARRRGHKKGGSGNSSVPKHRVPPLLFHGRHRPIGDLFGLGSFVVQRYPGLARQALYRAKLTGADWLREEFTGNKMHWGTYRRYRWSIYDRTVRQERRRGFHILGLLDYNNTWDGHPNSYMPHWKMPGLIRDYKHFVFRVVRHYRFSIDYWQIWNEPDLRLFWKPGPSARDYARLLTAAYYTVKRANPRARVVLGGPSGSDPHGFRFISRVVHAGGRFDILSIQPYRDVPDLQLIHEVRRVRRYGKPVWFTEMGWAGERWCMSICGPVDAQANRLARLYLVSAVAGAQRVFWYDFRDDGIGAAFEDHFGLLEHNLASKPAFLAYQLSRFYLNWGHLLGRDVLKPDVFAFRVHNHRHNFVILWNNRLDTYGLDIPWRGRDRARVLDWSGHEVARSHNGQIKVAVRPRTILYIVPSGFEPRLYRPSAAPMRGRVSLPPLPHRLS